MPTTFRRFVPRLQCLDDRSVPAVLVNLVGTTLVVTGDDAPNAITVSDSGQLGSVDPVTGAPSGGITVVADGVTHWFGTEVGAIVVYGNGGDDSVAYDLTGPLSATRLIGVELGRGRDTFTANLTGQSINGATTNLGISVQGDGGGDSMTLNAGGTTVDPAARLSVEFFGEAGKDAIAFNHDPGFELTPNVFLTKDQRR